MSTPTPGGDLPIIEQPPLAPPEIVPLPTSGPSAIGQIQYLDSLRYVFAHPEWFKNLLVFALFTLIPVLNTALVFGYLYEITEYRHRRLAGPYPLFEVRRFAAYVTRGIWCFLLVNLQVIVLLPIFEVLWNGTFFGSMFALRSGDWGVITVAVVVPLVMIAFLAFLLGLQIVLMPFLLRAGLSQDFLLMANFRWVAHFLRTMWVETTLVCLFVQLAWIPLAAVGCMLFCVGFLLAVALISMVQAHLHCQLYELYLARGGEPIPLRPQSSSLTP